MDRIDVNEMKITGTTWYVDIEYKDCKARFDGELCVDGFYTTASSLSWISYSRDVSADDLMDAVMRLNRENKFKVVFCNDDGELCSCRTHEIDDALG